MNDPVFGKRLSAPFSRYSVTESGEVYSHIGSVKKLSPAVDQFGYSKVTLSKDPVAKVHRKGKQSKAFFVHRLVLMCYNPVYSMDLLSCRHLNGIPSDNRLVNLAWGTASENCEDKIRHKLVKEDKGIELEQYIMASILLKAIGMNRPKLAEILGISTKQLNSYYDKTSFFELKIKLIEAFLKENLEELKRNRSFEFFIHENSG